MVYTGILVHSLAQWQKEPERLTLSSELANFNR
jgi:hypothetical protein